MSTAPQPLSEQLSLRLSSDQRAHIRVKLEGLNAARALRPGDPPWAPLTESDYIRLLIDQDRIETLRHYAFKDEEEART